MKSASSRNWAKNLTVVTLMTGLGGAAEPPVTEGALGRLACFSNLARTLEEKDRINSCACLAEKLLANAFFRSWRCHELASGRLRMVFRTSSIASCGRSLWIGYQVLILSVRGLVLEE
ncbi:hypothetical protein ABVK25_012334 [Lepraria finkii]|uniref:Secreted protein n=1 Tax=Lepraria finkii TaxID=1340010 RepID=A0ABR4AFK3_9LECA